MDNILNDMHPSLMRYAKITSQVLQTVVSFVDNQQIRLNYEGGTWIRSIGYNISRRGNIVKAALESGQPQVMLEAQAHPGCATCVNRGDCRDQVEMWVPIAVQDQILGVIGINCETTSQMQRVRENWDTYLEFLKQMAELISYEAMQRMEARKSGAVIHLLETVVDRLDSGVMVLDKGGNILRLNAMGRRLLQEVFSVLMEAPVLLHTTGEAIGHQKAYQIQQGEEQCTVAGSLHEINADPYFQVLIFNNADQMRAASSRRSAYYQITGTSPEIQLVRDRIKTAANSPSCVLICAEAGLGKELYARAIHDESDRRDKPFVLVDCASLPQRDAAQHLFGTASQTSTAGSRGKPGVIEAAEGGTLFLDNIDALPLPLQQLLVKLLERRELTRVGSKRQRRVNVRVIASAAPTLWEACNTGCFDRDLYYLISVIPITVPPLRSRREDIRPLAFTFIQRCARELERTVAGIETDFWDQVEAYDWPGNVRELRNAMEYAVNMMPFSGVIGEGLLPDWSHRTAQKQQPPQRTLEEIEREAICRAVQQYRHENLSREEIAKILGIGPATLYRKIKKYGL